MTAYRYEADKEIDRAALEGDDLPILPDDEGCSHCR